jgi:DNA repair exonuclease SbcCD ATPase subunit
MLYDTLTIHSVNPTGMFSYGRSEAIPILNKGLVHLVGVNEDQGGDSNGAGKSSLFNAICELLFHENPTGAKNDDVINKVWGRGMAGRIVFTARDGNHYRTTYCRNWKDPFYEIDNDNKVAYCGTALFLDKYDRSAGIWRDFRGSGMPETKEKVKALVGITYQRFLAISYMSHRVGNQFLRGTNKDRMDLLSGIIGIEEWDEILEKCRKLRKTLKDQVDEFNGKIAYEEGSVQTLREQLQNIRLNDIHNTITRLTEEVNAKREEWALKNLDKKKLEEEYQNIQKEQNGSLNTDNINRFKAEDSKLRIELNLIEKSRQPQYISPDLLLAKKVSSLENEISKLEGQLGYIQKSDNVLLSKDNCPTCSSPITENQKKKIKDEKESSINEIRGKIEGLKVELAKAVAENSEDLEKRKAAEKERQDSLYVKAQEIIMQLNQIHESLNREYEVYKSFDGKLKEVQDKISKVNAELAEIRAEGSKKSSEIEYLQSKLSDFGTLEGQISEKQANISFLQGEIKGVQRDVDEYSWLIDNIPSIKLHKMSNAMEEISNLVNDYFTSLGDTLRVNISPFNPKVKPKNASDTKSMMKDEVSVRIMDGNKDILPSLYSDGEISKVSLAVSKALHEMARKSGQGCNLMMMDEIFGFMDANNSQRIAQSLSNILNRGTVFLTDNSDKVRDLVNFKHVWTARKSHGQTVLEV